MLFIISIFGTNTNYFSSLPKITVRVVSMGFPSHQTKLPGR